VDELVPAAHRVPVEQPLVRKELCGGEELGDDALRVVGDASPASVGVGDAHEVGVEAPRGGTRQRASRVGSAC
jgi:hypothetical protein